MCGQGGEGWVRTQVGSWDVYPGWGGCDEDDTGRDMGSVASLGGALM